MQEKVRVISIEGDIAKVVPLDALSCAGCSNAECRKGGGVFSAANRKGLAIRAGSEVRIDSAARSQLAQAFLSIGIPVLLGIVAWAGMGSFFPGSGDGLRAGAALLAVLLGGTARYALSRGASRDLPEIVEIL